MEGEQARQGDPWRAFRVPRTFTASPQPVITMHRSPDRTSSTPGRYLSLILTLGFGFLGEEALSAQATHRLVAGPETVAFGHYDPDKPGVLRVRSVDFVARLGGEEFLLVLVGADEETAERVAERLCERTRFLAMIPEDPDYRQTVSIGLAAFQPGERVEDVIQRADRALYSAKAQGRDQIVRGS